MCNGNNHSQDCTCGFGGYSYNTLGIFELFNLSKTTYSKFYNEDFCYQSTCDRCGQKIFFVRHNGGSVSFDHLGPPWPKHSCYDDDKYSTALRHDLSVSPTQSHTRFGVIVKTVATRPGMGGYIEVRCYAETVEKDFDYKGDLSSLVGKLVLVTYDEKGCSLKWYD